MSNYQIIESTFVHLGQSGKYLFVVLTANSIDEITCRASAMNDDIPEDVAQISTAQTGGKFTRQQAIGFFPHHEKLINDRWKR